MTMIYGVIVKCFYNFRLDIKSLLRLKIADSMNVDVSKTKRVEGGKDEE